MKKEIIDLTDEGVFYDAIIRKCFHCGEVSFIKVTEEQYNNWIIEKMFVEDVFPELKKEEREQLISGIHEQCWQDMFYQNDEEEEI